MHIYVCRSIALLLALCTVVEGQLYEEGQTRCGAKTMYHCLDYEWKQPVPLAWHDGDQSLPDACKSFTETSAKTQKKITCISSPNHGNDNICLPKVTETDTTISLENNFAIHEEEIPGFVGVPPNITVKCTYEKTQTLTTSLATYEAKDVTLTGSGSFDVDLLPCGKLNDPSKLCTDADVYPVGVTTVPRQGNLYFRSCVKGAGSNIVAMIRQCTTYDAIPPGHTASTELATEYCGVKEFIDSARDVTYRTKIFYDGSNPCSMLQVAAHKYATSNNLYIACTITVCTEAKCNNLRALSLDDGDTCRQNWIAPPADHAQRRLAAVNIEGPGASTFRNLMASNGEASEGKDYKSVQILSNAKAPVGSFVIGGGTAKSQSSLNSTKDESSSISKNTVSFFFLTAAIVFGMTM